MREIKFRAWDKEHKKWVPGFFDINRLSWVGDYPREWTTIDNLIFVEFTGLLDKNGKEIWGGDILQWCDTTNVKNKWVVQDTPGGWNPFIDDMTTDRSFRYEVIGNIYETPHLLTREDRR